MLRGKLERFAGDPAQAVKTLEEGLDLAQKLPGGGENTTFVLLSELALALADAGQPEAALQKMRDALRVVEGNAGPSSPMAIIILARLGQLLTEQGRAEDALQPLLEARRRIDSSPALAGITGVVAPQRFHEGQARRRLGQFDAASRCYAEALALTAAPEGSADASIRAGAALSVTLAMHGKLAQAMEALAKAEAVQQRADIRGFAQQLMLAEARSAILLRTGDLKGLDPLWRSLESETMFAARLGEPGAQVLRVLAILGEQGADAAAAEAKGALERLLMGPPVPNRDYEAAKLRSIATKQFLSTASQQKRL
jgi:tetratricopeptide (TPR) repeat protein